MNRQSQSINFNAGVTDQGNTAFSVHYRIGKESSALQYPRDIIDMCDMIN